MNEAEKTNSDFKSVNSVNSTAAAQVKISSCNLTHPTLASVIVPASQAEQEVINCVTNSSNFEASENFMAQLAPSQKLELVSLIQVLRSNSNLIEQVTELEQALSECQAALQLSENLEQVTQLRLTQKQEELATAQAQVKCLSEEMESASQIAQRQQNLIETLTTDLQSSQERFAQLEWENYLTQANYTEKSEQLIQTENTCRELRTRLNRQQSYTLQLKVALEKCLEPISSTSDDANSDRIPTNANNKQKGRSIQIQSFFCNAESIPPWSAPPEFLTEEIATGWVEPSIQLDFQTQNDPHSALLNWSDEDLSTSLEVESITVVETNQPIPSQAAPFIDFIQQFVDIPSDRFSPSQPDELLEITNVEQPELPILASQAFSASEQLDQPLNQSNLSDCHLLDPASDAVFSDHKTQIQTSQPQPETSFFTPNSNWPSPLISPSRTSKRKSLAAIELPTFPRG